MINLIKKKINITYAAVAVILSFLRADSMYFFGDINRNIADTVIWILFFIRLLLYSVLFIFSFIVLEVIIEKLGNESRTSVMGIVGCDKEYGEYNRLKPYLLLTVIWIPLLLIKYPAAIDMDAWCILHEYRIHEITEHHSVFYTAIFGWLVNFCEYHFTANLGLFLFSCVHYGLYVIAFGYSINVIRDMRLPKMFVVCITVLYTINPYIVGYLGVITKDALYSAFVLLFFACLVDFEIDSQRFTTSIFRNIFLGISVMGIYLVRKNGKYVIFLTVVALFVVVVKRYRREHNKKQIIFSPVGIILICCIFSTAIFIVQEKHYNAEPASEREALSLLSQQTARYGRDYYDDVTEQEYIAIDRVFSYEKMINGYDPRRADATKGTYRGDSSRADFVRYLGVWGGQFIKHPLCYFQATMEQNYYLFVPEIDNISYNSDYELNESNKNEYEDIFSCLQWLKPLKRWIRDLFIRMHRIPVLGLLWNASMLFYWLIFLSIFAIKNKVGHIYISCPLILTIVFVLLGPIIDGFVRYMLPMIYCIYMYFVYIVYNYTVIKCNE